MLDNPEDVEWLISEWNTRDQHTRLLEHLCTAAQVSAMSLAKRHARLYQYAPEDIFRDLKKEKVWGPASRSQSVGLG